MEKLYSKRKMEECQHFSKTKEPFLLYREVSKCFILFWLWKKNGNHQNFLQQWRNLSPADRQHPCGELCPEESEMGWAPTPALQPPRWAGDPNAKPPPPLPSSHTRTVPPRWWAALHSPSWRSGDRRAAGGHAGTSPTLLPLSLPINTTTN